MSASSTETELSAAIQRAAGRGSVTMIPAFAVGRVQLLRHYLARLSAKGAIPDIPIFLDRKWHRLGAPPTSACSEPHA